jgi:hypothetical protein
MARVKKEVPNVMSRQGANECPQVGSVAIRRADDKMWLRQAGGTFEQDDIKGEFSSCVGISGGPVAIVNLTRGEERRQYIIDVREFVEAVLDAEAKLKG